ncbi:MAG: hypothetical protein KDA53_14585 [Hyphomonas sp.]|nr:hypothetical protein [Hyphomonas sp.]
MKKFVLWCAAAAIGIAGLVWLWRTVIAPPPWLEVSPLSYSDYGSWAVIPKESPEPVWTGGWAVDVFLIDEDSALKARSGAGLDKKEQFARLQGRMLEDGLSLIGPVYAPLYRSDAVGDDLSRAFRIYLKQHNRGRAFVIATNSEVPASVLSQLTGDADLTDRFGGFYRFGRTPSNVSLVDTDGTAEAAPVTAYCNAHLVDTGACVVDLTTVRKSGYDVLAPESGLADAPVTGLAAWLSDNVAPMAEPLGDLEEVEIIDIRRPGDTDERRRNND